MIRIRAKHLHADLFFKITIFFPDFCSIVVRDGQDVYTLKRMVGVFTSQADVQKVIGIIRLLNALHVDPENVRKMSMFLTEKEATTKSRER